MAIGKPSLIVHTTYFPLTDDLADVPGDPERVGAHELGVQLYERLTRPVADRLSWGAGVPVRIATRYDRVDLDEAKHVVIVPVLGARAHARADVRATAIQSLTEWSARTHVLPVLTAGQWRTQEGHDELPLAVKPFLTDLYGSREQTLDEIVLALARILAAEAKQATRLFISHAKSDLAATEQAAERILECVQRTTADKPFFDKISLLAGDGLGEQIDDEAGRGIFVAVRSDSYSSRQWCLRELLAAKRKNLPMITVEVLSAGEERSSAYSGNASTIVWRRGVEVVREPSYCDPAAAEVVRRAMVECVKSLLFLAEAKRIASEALPSESVVEMVRPPELLDIPALRARGDGMVIVLHPDPELSVHERGVLHDTEKRVRTVTPTTAFAGAIGRAIKAPLDGSRVALSLSKTPDIVGFDGVHGEHVNDANVFLARSLLGAGAAIAYGGDFRVAGYTEDLARLIGMYNLTARTQADLLHSFLAAHLPSEWTLPFTAHHLGDRYGTMKAEAVLDPPAGDLSAVRRALYFSDMRRVMEKHTHARVVMYGNVTPATEAPGGYGGRYPGVVEEAWRTLEAKHPLYVIGGFGGAAALVADLLEKPVPQ